MFHTKYLKLPDLKLLAAILLATGLTACASGPGGVAVNIQSARYLNPDVNGIASPLVVSIYQLKSPFTFNNANYGSLANNSAAILGTDLIDKQTMEIRPGENKMINLDLTQNTQYIGIVAGYRKINQAQWHTTIRIPGKGKGISIALNLESQGLSAHILKS